MSGSSYGKYFQITTWGESHGKAIGVVVDGCPAGLALTEEDIQLYLNRRKPGQTAFSTPRKEADEVEILSGVFDGKTTGTPISLVVYNTSQQSKDYSAIASYYRPGHADYTFDMKYGFRDYRGGGRSSGRETIGRVAAGAIALKLLKELNIQILAYTKQIGQITINMENFVQDEIYKNPFYMPDHEASLKASSYLEDCMKKQDSAGGVIECIIENMPIGIGEPVFDKLSANLAKAIFSIGAVKGFEIGDGFAVASSNGSSNNDSFVQNDGQTKKETNHAGGILGGLSDGSPIVFRASFKPTPSISSTQNTVNQAGENIQVQVLGRHDPVIVPRAVVVVESMTALTIVDLLFSNMGSKLSSLKDFYK